MACFLFFQFIKYGFLKLKLNRLRKETSLFTAELARLSDSTPSSIWEESPPNLLDDFGTSLNFLPEEKTLDQELEEAACRLDLSEIEYREMISTLPKSGKPHLE